MRKIIYFLAIIAAAVSYTSCTSEVDDAFDKQASVRVEEGMKEFKKILASAPNGWAMHYYGNTNFGGYNLLCKFTEDNSVTVANEFFDDDKTATTHYKVEQSAGIVLSFDTYCELIHFFSDPVNPQGFGSAGEGFGGDMEFRVLSMSNEKIMLQGKKTGARIAMTPLADNVKWADYLKKVHEVENDMYSMVYDITDGENTMRMRRSMRCFTYTVTEDEQTIKKQMPYTITPDGIEFYEDLELGEKTINKFAYKAASDSYTEANNPGVTMSKVVLNPNDLFVSGVWYVKYSELGKLAKTSWNSLRKGLDSTYGYKLIMACFGVYSTDFGFYFAPGNDEEGYFLSELKFNYTLEGEDKVTMWFTGEGDLLGNGIDFYNNKDSGVKKALSPFGSDENHKRTFTVTTDDLKRPTYVELADDSNSKNVIRLFADEVRFPFDE